MHKDIIRIEKSFARAIARVNDEVTQLQKYTGDDYPLLSSEGDSYNVSPIVIEGGYIKYTITYISDKYEMCDPLYYGDDEEGYIKSEDVLGSLKVISRDCKRGLKDYRMFNPDVHEDENGDRKDGYMNSLNGSVEESFVAESLNSHIGRPLKIKVVNFNI